MSASSFVMLAAAAGAATAVQAAANAGLSARIGLAATLVLNALVVLVCALGFQLARGGPGTFFAAGTPWHLYVGGFCGFFIIFSMASAFLKSTPPPAPLPIATTMLMGVARPSAQGQAMMSTATELTSA